MVAVPNTPIPQRRSSRSPAALIPNKPTPGRLQVQPISHRGTLAVRPTVSDLRVQPLAPTNKLARPMKSAASVQALPTHRPLPGWLRTLMVAQRIVTPLTLVCVGALSAVYGWRVHTQQAWDTQYRHMEALERQERQLIAADEIVKHQLAEEALQDESGLVTSNLNNTLFLDAPAPPPDVDINPARSVETDPVMTGDRPFGY